jgi:hypothetical protein
MNIKPSELAMIAATLMGQDNLTYEQALRQAYDLLGAAEEFLIGKPSQEQMKRMKRWIVRERKTMRLMGSLQKAKTMT